MLFKGAWGKMIHEKNLKQKSCDTVPLRESIVTCFFAFPSYLDKNFLGQN
jgi:hypothetical protein